MGGLIDPSTWVELSEQGANAGTNTGANISINMKIDKQIVSHADANFVRRQIEECQLAERIRQSVVEINKDAGFQILSLLDYMPPQSCVLRLAFCKDQTEYVMRLVAANNVSAVVFQSVTTGPGPWYRFRAHDCSERSHVVFSKGFTPKNVSDDNIRMWIAFLLSRFSRKFHPRKTLQAVGPLQCDLHGLVQKAAA